MFRTVYSKIDKGGQNWEQLVAPEGNLYKWDGSSTYIKKPPFFSGMSKVGIISRHLFQNINKYIN